MAARDPRLGPFGLYSKDKTDEIGLEKAVNDTIMHLLNHPHINKDSPKGRDLREAVSNLRTHKGT